MKKTFGLLFVAVFGLLVGEVSAALLPGDIAFVGFNADGDDGFAIVALTDISAGEGIYFRDEEWDGAAFGTGEGEFLWTTPALAVGSVVTFVTDISPSSPTTSAGTISSDAAFAPGDMGISSGGETIFAYQGASNSPTTFLAAIGSDQNGIQDSIVGTGLVLGSTAIELVGGAITDGPDIAEYSGPRSSEIAFGDYLSLIGNQANWTIQQGGSGDQSTDGTAPDVPFNSTAFTIVPEPTSVTLLGTLILAALFATRV